MKKDILIKYRDRNQELDLLGALEKKGLDQYDEDYKKLIEILLLMLSITEKNDIAIQQFLFNSIYSQLDTILNSEKSRTDFVKIISESINEDNDKITSFVYRFILNIKDDVDGIGRKENIGSLKDALEQINIDSLSNAIEKDKEYSLIIKLFYNCVADMESDRRVILHEKAIEKFREYIEKKPIGYLKHFLRPYYTGPNKQHLEYFLHIGEPFCVQIFPKNGEFVGYLHKIKGRAIDVKLIADVKMFFERVSSNPKDENKAIILYSSEIENLPNKEDYPRLLSSEHVWVRPECLPPRYKS